MFDWIKRLFRKAPAPQVPQRRVPPQYSFGALSPPRPTLAVSNTPDTVVRVESHDTSSPLLQAVVLHNILSSPSHSESLRSESAVCRSSSASHSSSDSYSSSSSYDSGSNSCDSGSSGGDY